MKLIFLKEVKLVWISWCVAGGYVMYEDMQKIWWARINSIVLLFLSLVYD